MEVTLKGLMEPSTRTSTVIQDMNAKALSQMEQGRNEDAVQVLRQAVRDLGMWMPGYQEVMRSSSSRIKNSYVIHQHAVALPQLCHDGHNIYNRAFLLPFSDEAISSVKYRTQVIAIILYNMALASHRHEIQSGKRQPLAHAAFAYIAVLDMVGPNAMDLFPEIAVLLLAIISNLAQIHLELRQMPEFVSARSFLHELTCNIRLDQMSTQDFGFFSMQIFCFDRETTWYAPAA